MASSVSDPPNDTWKGQHSSILTIFPAENSYYSWSAKGLATLCVQSAQSRTRSSEIAFLRSLKIVQLIWNTRTEPHYDGTQKRNLGRTRPRLRTLYA